MTDKKILSFGGKRYDYDSLSEQTKTLVDYVENLDKDIKDYSYKLDIAQAAKKQFVADLKKQLFLEDEEQDGSTDNKSGT